MTTKLLPNSPYVTQYFPVWTKDSCNHIDHVKHYNYNQELFQSGMYHFPQVTDQNSQIDMSLKNWICSSIDRRFWRFDIGLTISLLLGSFLNKNHFCLSSISIFSHSSLFISCRILIFSYSFLFISVRVVGVFRMVLQKLINENNLDITDSLLDGNNTVLKVWIPFFLKFFISLDANFQDETNYDRRGQW